MRLSARVFRHSQGGTPIEDIRDLANSMASLTIGGWVQEPGAGDYLEKEFGVAHCSASAHKPGIHRPSGWQVWRSRAAFGMPESYERERGRLLDTMVDAHKLLADVKTAVYGDTEMVLGINRLMAELGMRPQIVATGAANSAFAESAAEIAPGCKVMIGADFSEIAEEASSRDIELMVGPFTGRGLARREKVPLLRVGLPNHDRYGASHQLLLGYEGSMHLVEGMANALLDERDSGHPKRRRP